MLSETRASLSKTVLDFERRNGLSVGLGRKSLSARRTYAHAHGDGSKTRNEAKATAFRHLSIALGHLSKLAESSPVSKRPEGERDVLRSRVARLKEIAAVA